MKNLPKLDVSTPVSTATGALDHPAWSRLKTAVETIRPLQARDGSIPAEGPAEGRAEGRVESPAEDRVEDRAETGPAQAGRAEVGAPHAVARAALAEVVASVGELAPLFPHDAAYLDALVADLERWGRDGFGVPDFLDSLLAFQPSRDRRDGREHLVVFPMYTQNGNPNRNLEALLVRVVWPEWLARLEADRYDNPMFVPISFVDFTAGYDTDSAVLFPETVSVREVPGRYSWGGIFCDREAVRFRRVSSAAVDLLGLHPMPEEARRLLTDQRHALETFVLWDLVHDRTHSHGDLPFDPFMIKQRNPFWMYALEELRCDLTAFREAVRLEAEGEPHGRSVQYAVFFDRLFRFPVTGSRVRNYDGLGGQLLFAHLHRSDVLRWTDNRLWVDWEALPGAVVALLERIETLYREGIDRPKVVHWIAAHRMVSEYLAPHPASRWARGVDALPVDGPPRGLVDAVLPDEFPLSMFYETLHKKLKDVISSTRGITADAPETRSRPSAA
ncbi:DUF6421 family protein [Allostreptomyces psammosilenae]|uniref:Uncharacterized protein n=1 Tax=Allostreptomyces psammosilenae TaxID=1892865 RepID=A0A853AAL4_9ACTN|nr:DUF6421 family protein [Allostreptomyces psammosilenae]NYI07412.1 hypothetical protein [Allostreptomyces psammosilenae]